MAMAMTMRPIRVRTMLLAIVAFAVAFALVREWAIWRETREFVAFHQSRARWLRNRSAEFPPARANLAGEFRRCADWHDERALFYRKVHKTYFSDEMIEDFRQTEREQVIERALRESR